MPDPFLTPDPQAVADSYIMDFAHHVGIPGSDYAHLAPLVGRAGAGGGADARRPLVPGATLNYAHHALRNHADDAVAVIALDETGSCYEVTAGHLRAQVASIAATLRELGVGPGDRVVGYLPNTPHAIVAGAIRRRCRVPSPARRCSGRCGWRLVRRDPAVRITLQEDDPVATIIFNNAIRCIVVQ